MIDASRLAPYIGFTEEEVKELCEKYQVDFEKVKCWYDGYFLEDYQVYNPKAVVSVMAKKKFKSYWSKTGTYEAIVPLIKMDFDGLKTAFIPNEEIRQELIKATRRTEWNELFEFQKQSSDLLNATLDMDADSVAAGIEKIHMEYVSRTSVQD